MRGAICSRNSGEHFLNEAKGMRVGLGQATRAAEKGPRDRPRKSCQSFIQVREDLVWDVLKLMSVGHLGRSPKAVGN